MQITIIATGSRGDVQPYVALGRGLLKAGHDIRFVTHRNYEELVALSGLTMWPVEGDVQSVAQSQAMQDQIEKGNFITLMAQMAKEAKGNAILMTKAGLAASRDADLLLGGFGGVFVGVALAERLDIPFIQAYYVPFTPTKAFPGALTPNLPSALGNSANRLTHHAARQVMWQGFRSADKAARQEVLDLPPTSFWGPYQSQQTRGCPILYGFSPSVVPPPPDWGPDIHVTGYWFLDESEQWSPPSDLLAFLDAGSPPVAIGFGSMSNRDPEAMAGLVIESVEESRQRAVLLSGWGGLRKRDLPDSIFMIDAAPHSWLFPRMAAVVHHGGAGTTAAGLRAGVPSIIVPHFGDQPFWGQRVSELGVGPEPIPRKKLTADRLADAIRQAVNDATMQKKAAALGTIIQAEDGVARAVEAIQRHSQSTSAG